MKARRHPFTYRQLQHGFIAYVTLACLSACGQSASAPVPSPSPLQTAAVEVTSESPVSAASPIPSGPPEITSCLVVSHDYGNFFEIKQSGDFRIQCQRSERIDRSLHGFLLDAETGFGIKDVKISLTQLTREDGTPAPKPAEPTQTSTDGEGSFYLGFSEAGTYQLKIEASGYGSESRQIKYFYEHGRYGNTGEPMTAKEPLQIKLQKLATP